MIDATSKKLVDIESIVRKQDKQILFLMKQLANLEKENARRKREIDQLSQRK